VIVLTAATESHMGMVDLQRKSVAKFNVAHHVCLTIPAYYPKHPSWFRIRGLIDHLPKHDYILWMDTDSIIIREPDLEQLVLPTAILNVAKDHNGLNNGVGIWKNTPETIEILWDIYDSHPKFKDHPWHEQGALHTMQERMDIHWIPKETLDKYISHFPNTPDDERMRLMTAALETP